MRIVDNLIALRIIYLLVTPFEKTDAFKLGLIDANGNKLKDAQTSAETNATSMLHRLVWNLKKIINLAPGGKTRIGSLVAAYLLVKESFEKDKFPTDKEILESFKEHQELEHPLLEQVITEAYCSLFEDAPVNATGVAVSTNAPAIRKKKKFASFDVSSDTFKNFKNGKSKYRKWSSYLNLSDDTHKQIYNYAKKNPRGILVLKDEQGNMKGIRYSRNGSGNWHNIKRKTKLTESVETISDYDFIIEQL